MLLKAWRHDGMMPCLLLLLGVLLNLLMLIFLLNLLVLWTCSWKYHALQSPRFCKLRWVFVPETTLSQTPHSAGSLRHWVRPFFYYIFVSNFSSIKLSCSALKFLRFCRSFMFMFHILFYVASNCLLGTCNDTFYTIVMCWFVLFCRAPFWWPFFFLSSRDQVVWRGRALILMVQRREIRPRPWWIANEQGSGWWRVVTCLHGWCFQMFG